MTNTKTAPDKIDKSYYARCIKQLKEVGAPLEGWYCVGVNDVREEDRDAPLSQCELCGCSQVRYEHVMEHAHYLGNISVGCICAGIMEGDILKAQDREKQMQNRAKRRKTFLAHSWKHEERNIWYRRYRGQDLVIRTFGDDYVVYVDGKGTGTYRGKRIRDLYSALHAAFNLADPVEAIL